VDRWDSEWPPLIIIIIIIDGGGGNGKGPGTGGLESSDDWPLFPLGEPEDAHQRFATGLVTRPFVHPGVEAELKDPGTARTCRL
jgi:hypothetical protein